MDSNEDVESLKIVEIDKSDLWSAIEWQQSQVHHYQLMARGLVALIITVVSVIVASLTTSLWGPFPPLPTEYTGISAAVSGTPFSANTGVIIVGFSVFQIFLFSGLLIVSTLISGYRFASVMFDYRIKTGIEPDGNQFLLTSDSVSNSTAEEELYAAVHRNQAVLERVTDSFESASVRLSFAILAAVSVYILYFWVVEFRIWNLVYIQLFPLVPIQHITGVPERLLMLAPGGTTQETVQESIFQPYIDSFNETKIDSILFGLSTLINVLVAIAVGGSLLFSIV